MQVSKTFKISFALDGIGHLDFNCPIMDLDVIDAIIKSVKTGSVHTLITELLTLDAHPEAPNADERFPVLRFGNINIDLSSEKDRQTALKLLNHLRDANFNAKKLLDTSYRKVEISHTKYVLSVAGDSIEIRKVSNNGTHRLFIRREHLLSFLDHAQDYNPSDYAWHIEEDSDFGRGGGNGQHWAALPTGYQNQFALSVWDDEETVLQSMVINLEDLPMIFEQYIQLGWSDGKLDLEKVKKNCRYDWQLEAKKAETPVSKPEDPTVAILRELLERLTKK